MYIGRKIAAFISAVLTVLICVLLAFNTPSFPKEDFLYEIGETEKTYIYGQGNVYDVYIYLYNNSDEEVENGKIYFLMEDRNNHIKTWMPFDTASIVYVEEDDGITIRVKHPQQYKIVGLKIYEDRYGEADLECVAGDYAQYSKFGLMIGLNIFLTLYGIYLTSALIISFAADEAFYKSKKEKYEIGKF